MKTLQFVNGRTSNYSVRKLTVILGLLAIAGPVLGQQVAIAPKAGGDPNKLYLQSERSMSVSYAGKSATVQAFSLNQLKPLALAAGDFDGDGAEDVVVGYAAAKGGVLAVYRGNLDAFAPQSQASWQAIGEGRFPSPFLPQATTIELPEAPDFVATGVFTNSGHLDVVVGARGSQTIYLLAGDGAGGFLAPKAISLPGALTSLGTTHFDSATAYSHIVAGTTSQTGSQLTIFGTTETGINAIATAALQSPATALAFGNLSGGNSADVAVVAGGGLLIVHGRDVHATLTATSPITLQPEVVTIPFSASSVTIGSFISDRAPRLQMAVLGTDGSVHIVTRAGLDTRPWSLAEMRARRSALLNRKPDPLVVTIDPNEGWQVAESFPGIVSTTNPSQPPILFRTRISSRAADDVMILDSNLAQMHVLGHGETSAAGVTTPSLPPSIHSTLAMNASQPTVAGIPMRVNIDGRPGVVVLKQGQMAPQIMMPLPDPTFFVNKTTDPTPTSPIANACNNVSSVDLSSSCSLREAILKANSIAGTDTIMVPAGTITLSLARIASDFTGNQGTLEVTDSVNIVGAGQNTTIIQGGTNLTTSVDKVFSFNEDIAAFTNATVSISNLTIQNGHNRGNAGIGDGWGGAFDFDTGGTNAATATATLTMTNCTIVNNTLTEGEGGGVAFFNTNGGSGFATITNSIIQNNTTAPSATGTAGNGGGIFVGFPARMVMNNSQVLNNTSTANAGINPVGGGIEIIGNAGGSGQTVIHGSTIHGNHADGDGGGIWNTANLLIDTSSVISGNSTGGAGGGVWHNPGAPDTGTLSKVTITGNTATGAGGGIALVNGSGGVTLTMSFSRLAGNTAASGSNLSNGGGTVNATDNWWGTNTPATTINTGGGFSTTFDPFIVLTHTASPSTIRINQSTTLTASFLQDNHGTAISASNLDVLVNPGLPITFNNAVDGTITGAQAAIQPAGTATATFNAGNVAGGGSADAVVDQATVVANIVVLQPPSITKSFNPTTVKTNTPSTVTFGITNPNVVTINASFADTLPANLVVATTPSVSNTCGGTVTATAGSGNISFSNPALPIGGCTITVNVQSAVDNLYNNSVTIDSTDAGNGNTASANLTVINPPAIAKTFGAATVPLNGTTSLTFTVSSANANLTLNGVAFTDSLPAGLIVATPSNLNSTCSGTATALNGSSSISLSGASLAPGTSCTVSVNATGTTTGVKNNAVQITSTNGGTGNTSIASITVVAPPVIIKAFGAASIPLNGSTSLTFTIQNNNATQSLSGTGFSDTFPAGLVISTPNGLTGSCGGGAITATQGTNVVSLSGATLAASASCTFSINVTGIAAGQQNNTTGAVTSTEGGTGGTASASVTVVAPPSIAKTFNPTVIALNATTSLTFTITNPVANTVALTGVAFTDTIPTGLTVPNASATVCGGTVTLTAPTGIALSGATIAANSQCQFSVTVTGAASGQYTNTTGSVTATNGGTGNTATANLTVASPPSIAKVFGAASVPLNGTTSLTLTIQNPNPGVALTGIAFVDSLPAGLVVATPSGLSSTCGGTATAVGGSGSVSLSAGTVAASASCTVSVNVTGTTVGVKNNSVQVTSTEGGTGNISNASITVVAPPVIIKAFGAASIPVNGSTSLTFTIQNNNTTTALTGVAFSDTLPAGLVVATPNGLTGVCGGGTITATAGTGVINLSGASLASSTSCTFAVNVTGTTAGAKNNTTGAVTSTEGGTGGTASASVTVAAPPSIAKVFTPATIALNATTSLTFTITNPVANTVALTGVAFTDTIPTGLTVPNASATVCGGTVTLTAPTGIAISGATIAANSQCQFSVTVTGAASGQYTNTTGSVTSTNGGTGNTATANLTVASPPSIAKAFGAVTIPLNGTTSLTFTVTNPNTNVTLTGLAFTDNLPAGMVVATPNGLTNTCGGTATAVGGAGSLGLSAGTLATSASCTVSVNITGTTAGVKNNAVQVTSTEGGTGNTSNASITVIGPPVIIKAFGAASIPLNGSTSLTFTIQNNNTTQGLSGVAFSDTLPAGLVISTPNGLIGSCGAGTITSTAGTNIISLSGATLAASSSCTFGVNVTGTAAGTQNNTTGQVSSIQGGTGGTASASIAVVAPPSIAKVFNPNIISPLATTSLTFTITNPAANTVAETGVAFTDTLPTGLTVPNASATVCGGTVTLTAPTGIALSGATIAVNSQCQFSVTVTGAASGQYTNTTGSVTSTNGGTGNTASANLSVAISPAITKLFGASIIPFNGTTSLTFTIQNANAGVALTGLAFTDNLPAGMVVATPNGLTNTCGGTVTAVAGAGSATLAGGTLATNASCTVSLNVTGTTSGVKNNSVTVTSTNAGTGNTSNASLTVVSPPVIIKAFGAATVPLNGSTSLSFTLNNPNATQALSGVAFADTFPAGLVVATPNGLTGTCGGGTITATAGSNAVSLSGATLAASGSCTFSINVTGTTAGTQNNTTSAVTSTQGGTGGTASASLTVVAPPAIAKAFNPTSINPNGTSTLTVTLTNPAANSLAEAGVAFTDTLPAGLVIATPNGLTNTCGGTATGPAGSGSLSLTGGSIAASSTCAVSVNVTAATGGQYTNTTGAVSSTNGGTGNTATATLTVGIPPTITKAFGAASIGLAASTSLTFTVNNPNSTLAYTGVAFTDALPAGLVVSTPNGLTGTCGTGTVTAAAGSQSVTLTGGTIAVSSSCSFSVNVTGVAAGNQVNTTGAVSATNGGTGNTATASITVLAPDLTISKSHTGNFFQGQSGATYTVTANNVGQGPTAGTVTVTEIPPAGLTVTALAGTGWTCNVGALSCTRSDALAAGSSYPVITVTVSVAANSPATVTNMVTVSGGGELNLANDSASDSTTVTLPPDFSLAVAPPSIIVHAGLTASYTLTVTPLNNAFSSAITLTVTGLPNKSTFSFTPATLTPGANPATSTMLIGTSAGDPFLARNSGKSRAPLYAMFLPVAGLLLSGAGFRKKAWRKGKGIWVLFAFMLVCTGMAMNGCATARNLQSLGTPPGTYNVTVTATSGNIQHSAPAVLVVQP